MEGVTFALRECLTLIAELEEPSRVIISGGAAQSTVWRQIQADVYGRPLWLAQGENHACIGAALLAGLGCGVYNSIDEAAALLPPPTERIDPNPAHTALYAEQGEIFRGLYPKLKNDMRRLSGR
jgi:xylulokinase